MNEDDLERRLEQAGEQLAAAARTWDAAMVELAALVLEAHGAVPVALIAALGGISRPAVYKIVADAEKEHRRR